MGPVSITPSMRRVHRFCLPAKQTAFRHFPFLLLRPRLLRKHSEMEPAVKPVVKPAHPPAAEKPAHPPARGTQVTSRISVTLMMPEMPETPEEPQMLQQMLGLSMR